MGSKSLINESTTSYVVFDGWFTSIEKAKNSKKLRTHRDLNPDKLLRKPFSLLRQESLWNFARSGLNHLTS